MNIVRTKKLKSGNKLVVVNINNQFEYAPRYRDLKEMIYQLMLLYGKDEVLREIGLSSFIAKGEASLIPSGCEYMNMTKVQFESVMKREIFFCKTKYLNKEGIEETAWIEDPYTKRYFPLQLVNDK